jgi:hypothetical protein
MKRKFRSSSTGWKQQPSQDVFTTATAYGYGTSPVNDGYDGPNSAGVSDEFVE